LASRKKTLEGAPPRQPNPETEKARTTRLLVLAQRVVLAQEDWRKGVLCRKIEFLCAELGASPLPVENPVYLVGCFSQEWISRLSSVLLDPATAPEVRRQILDELRTQATLLRIIHYSPHPNF
jgi:hypothetical protein